MSTTRWIIETDCPHGFSPDGRHWGEGDWCSGSRIVVDPANLPPEAIQRAARAIVDMDGGTARQKARAAITAFLSDPEPDKQ